MILLYGIIFITYYIGFLTVADISIFFLMILGLLKIKGFYFNRYDILYFLFLMSLFIPGIIYYNHDFFNFSDFIFSYLKILFYSFALLILPKYFLGNIERFNKILLNIITIIFSFGLVQFLTYSSPIGHYFNFNPSAITYGFFRVTSFFNEPSILFFPIIIYYYLVISKVEMKKIHHLLVIIVTILSFSMTVYGVYLAGLIVLYNKKSMTKKVTVVSIVLILSIVSFVSVPLIQSHVLNLINMEPSSSTTRLLGGFEYAMNSPFFGVGLGNIESYYLENNSMLGLTLLTERGTVNNILAVIKIFSGYIGLICFISYLFLKYKYNNTFLHILFVSFFAWGNFNTAAFFFLLILLEVLRLSELKLSVKKKSDFSENEQPIS